MELLKHLRNIYYGGDLLVGGIGLQDFILDDLLGFGRREDDLGVGGEDAGGDEGASGGMKIKSGMSIYVSISSC